MTQPKVPLRHPISHKYKYIIFLCVFYVLFAYFLFAFVI